MPIGKRLGAEFLGTLVLVMGGCGAAMTAMAAPGSGPGHLGVALTFGLFMTALAFALGNVSGAHFNPAVTLGLFVARRFPGKDVMPYMLAQLGGALLGAGTLYVIVSGRAGFSLADGFFANGFGELSPGGYSLRSVMAAEVLLTFFYVMVIAATTDRRALTAVAPIAAGVALTAVYILAIPLDAGSINPARSIAAAMLEGGRSIKHVWLFLFAPLMGGALAGAVVPLLLRNPSQDAGEA